MHSGEQWCEILSYYSTHNTFQTAERFGVSKNQIYRHAKRFDGTPESVEDGRCKRQKQLSKEQLRLLDSLEQWNKAAETITVPEDIVLSDLSVLIRDRFGIPEGRSYAFYMTNTVRPLPYQYSDLVENGYLDGGKTTLKQALQGPKFKYEYSFSDGLIFQCEVKD